MAKLNKRGRLYSARVRWYEKGKQKEKTIGLITDSERVAMERIREIDKVEKYMKKGLSFTFPWESEKTIQTQLKRFTLMDAAEEWMESRIDSVSKNTFKTIDIKPNTYMAIYACFQTQFFVHVLARGFSQNSMY